MDRLDHIAIQVQDIPRALEWYRSRFDVEVVYADETWAMLRFGNVDLALVVTDQHPPHIAVQREDAERWGTLVAHRDGTASVYVRDPSGNVLEVMKKRN